MSRSAFWTVHRGVVSRRELINPGSFALGAFLGLGRGLAIAGERVGPHHDSFTIRRALA